jgi:flagellar biosynthesis GTPase FlhF
MYNNPTRRYVLIYPQGCDVANHLSLFLCVADYDKLLPGWSHFAQFTVAVANRDPKKSKYSDTLHRFCKKEHDWGWKKFMELGKVSDGFTAADALVIKAQVQVIRDRPARPFRCLDPQYRRELLRVYLANVEGIARRFVDEKREWLSATLLAPGKGFREYWARLCEAERASLASEVAAPVLKGLVRRFFNEKEVTSTLVMDALHCGAKALEAAARNPEGTVPGGEGGAVARPTVLIDEDRGMFYVPGDVIAALERAAAEPIPPAVPDKAGEMAGVRGAVADAADEGGRDSVERDERRLADVGRRVVEVFALAHIASVRMEAAWAEHETMQRQEDLLLEMDRQNREEEERQAVRAEAEKEKRARKKEKTKKKKEAERVKKETEEAERAAVEEARRAEQQRKAKEAEERRRREDEAQRAEHERALAVAKQQADARKAAKAAKDKQERAAAATSPAPTQPVALQHSVAAIDPSETASSGLQSQASLDSMAVATAAVRPASEADGSDASASTEAPDSGAGLIASLRGQVARLTEACSRKDGEIFALRTRVGDLEGQLAAALAPRPRSSNADLDTARSPGKAEGRNGMYGLENGHSGLRQSRGSPMVPGSAVLPPTSPSGSILAPASLSVQHGGDARRVGGPSQAGMARQHGAQGQAGRANHLKAAMNPSAAQFTPTGPGGPGPGPGPGAGQMPSYSKVAVGGKGGAGQDRGGVYGSGPP